jgi:hypothetical protein
LESKIRNLILSILTRDLLIDLEDGLRAEALKAFEIVRDHAGLDKKRARESEGQLRFRMMEHCFEEVCQTHGGKLLNSGVIPHTDLKVFQPFMRFEADGVGIILGLAAMPEPKALPTKNRSRLAGVHLNYELTPRLAFIDSGPKPGDIFVMLLVSRHREKAGQIEEVAVGVISSNYEFFLFYESLDQFLAGYADLPAIAPAEEGPIPANQSALTTISLKEQVTPFVPPEAEQEEEAGAEDPTAQA